MTLNDQGDAGVHKNKSMKAYRFITKYLLLLALPMLLAVGSMFAFSVLSHRLVMEQKVSALNHTLAVAEREMLDQIEQILSFEGALDRVEPIDASDLHKERMSKVWAEKVRLNGLLSLLFFTDENGQSFTSDEGRDRAKARDPSYRVRSATGSKLFNQAMASTTPYFMTPVYRDRYSGNDTLTILHRLHAYQGVEERLLGADSICRSGRSG